MTDLDADVLVVGAGPAGSTAAYHLASRAIDVLLVDRATFPREKVCGDGLTPRGVRALTRVGVDAGHDGFFRIEGVRTHGGRGRPVTFDWPGARARSPVALTRRRLDLDHLLVERAVEAGATIRQGVHAERPLREGRRVVGAALTEADGTEREVHARFVVAADGAAGRFAAAAGVRRDPNGPVAVAARRYYRSPRHVGAVFEAFLTLRRDGRWLPGYGWIFPMGDGELNVGAYVVQDRRHGVSAHGAFDLFVRSLPREWGIDEEHATSAVGSAAIPMAINRRPVALPGLLVTGDAAGIVNPFTGEGIAYAMESAELAAGLIAESIARDDPSIIAAYPARIRERYGRFFGAGRLFTRAISHPAVMKVSSTAGMRVTPLARAALRSMAHMGPGELRRRRS